MIEFNFTANDDKCEGTTNFVESCAFEVIEATKQYIKDVIKVVKANAADKEEEEEILFDLENVIGEVFDIEVYGIEVEGGGEYEDI